MLALIEWLGGRDEIARTLGVAVLVAARVAPLTILTPWIALRGTPPMLRAALLLGLTVALTPLALSASGELPPELLSFAVAAAREAAIGSVFAIAVAVPLHALDQSGRLVDALRGASQSESVLPAGDRSSPLGTLHLLLGAALFLSIGGHRLVLESLGEGLVAAPPASTTDAAHLGAFALGAARIVTLALTLAVSFAAPAAVSLAVVEIGLGLAGRAAPAIPMHFAGMPIRAALGVAAALFGLAFLVPYLPGIFESAVRTADELVRTLG
jgi:type III secretory pathway component EscT